MPREGIRPVLRIQVSWGADTPDECLKGEEAACKRAVIDPAAVLADLTEGPEGRARSLKFYEKSMYSMI